jgi:hypothetical protein
MQDGLFLATLVIVIPIALWPMFHAVIARLDRVIALLERLAREE